MKKIVSLCLGLFAALAIQAQSDFPLQFVDKNGNEVTDGTTLNITEAEDDGFGGIIMPSGLSVKNTSSDEVQCGGAFIISSMSNGAFQSCFPTNCMQASQVVQSISKAMTQKSLAQLSCSHIHFQATAEVSTSRETEPS